MHNSGNKSLRIRTLATGLAILLIRPLYGQVSLFQDTIRINEVIITSKKSIDGISGYKNGVINSAIIEEYSDATLAGLLVENSLIFIKSYGMGGSATPSFRGTGANHTQLQWNNININSPMLGQSDFSLVPAGLIDEVGIRYGGSSLYDGIGGIGGTINIGNKPDWRTGPVVTFSPSVGSFGQYSGLIKVKAGNLNFQSVTKAYLGFARNDFTYLNDVQSSNPVKEVMKNSEIIQKGLMQEIYYKKNKDILSARLWYQFTDRNLPSSMLIPQASDSENQIDESIRTMISYDGKIGLSEYFVTGAFSLSELDYTNQLAAIDSRNRSETVTLKSGFTNSLGENVRMKIIFENEHALVKTENYDGTKARRNVASLSAITEINSKGKIGASFLLKEILQNRIFSIPDFSAGLQFKISDVNDYYLKANFSRNSKLPAMNDLFWVPGGNTELQNESAYTYELMYEMAKQISSPLNLKFDFAIYHNTITNMIQWRPGIYSYWIADNVKSVNTSGIESSASFVCNINKLTTALNISYTFTNATTKQSDIQNDESIGKQLIYVPEHMAHVSLRLSLSGFYANWRTAFTGYKYTTSDNSSMLPAYMLNSVSSGYKFHRKSNNISLGLTVDNLFDISYQTIAYYPQPGRFYSIKLLIQFIK
ncbi:MAG TPA: TonB-dependent receptor plug domain-containing protein [Bacteroidales bacterium]|nr:TonB-dependent receptor plug domain-containing protein [Bacteroidales bacterium]